MSLHANIEVARGDFHLELDFRCHGVVAIMGPNGAGKTTFLRALLGAIRLRRGWIELHGRVLVDTQGGLHIPTERRSIAYVPQGYGLFPHLSVRKNVEFGIALPPNQSRRVAERWMAQLEIASLSERRPQQLSGGERQRVALARALARAPDLLLLDEPTSVLDTPARKEVRAVLADALSSIAAPAVIATHDPADVRALADFLVVLEDGRIVQQGAPKEVAYRPKTPFVAALATELLRDPSSSSRRNRTPDEAEE